MTDPVFYRFSSEPSLDAAQSPEAIVQHLLRVSDASARAMRIAQSAAGASRRMQFDLPEGANQSNTSIVKLLDILQGDSFSSFEALELLATKSAGREALQIRALFEDMVNELVETKSALTTLATNVTRELVGEPGKLISGNDLARMLGVSEEAVRQRLQAGKLIAILSDGRERGRGFPVFQAWAGIAGVPLEKVLKAFGYEGPGKTVDAADAFLFLVSRNDLLGDFTPVEVLTGAGLFPQDIEAEEFLAKPYQERLAFVISVAQSIAEARDA